jgi:hypothetical protein
MEIFISAVGNSIESSAGRKKILACEAGLGRSPSDSPDHPQVLKRIARRAVEQLISLITILPESWKRWSLSVGDIQPGLFIAGRFAFKVRIIDGEWARSLG